MWLGKVRDKYANVAQTSQGKEEEQYVVIAVILSCQHLPQQSDRQTLRTKPPTCSDGRISLSIACVAHGILPGLLHQHG